MFPCHALALQGLAGLNMSKDTHEREVLLQ